MADYKGSLLVESNEWNYSQDEGQFHTIRGRGRSTEVIGRVNALIEDGYDASYNQGEAYWDFTATRNYKYVDSPIVERWTLTTESLEKDLFSHPDIAAEMYAHSTGAAKYKKVVEEAVDTGDAPSETLGSNSTWLIRELSRGVQGYEHEYHVLSRTITFDRLTAETLGSPFNMSLNLSKLIMQSSTLASTQNIPTEVLFSLPADRTPAQIAQDQAARVCWGWRLREQRAEIDTSTTGMFQMSWTYAAWSTFLYTPYTV